MESGLYQIFANFGFPALITGVLTVAVWRAGIWLVKNVATPLTNSHVSLVETLQKILPEIQRAQDAADEREAKNHQEIIQLTSDFNRQMIETQKQLNQSQSEIIKLISSVGGKS